MINSGECNGMMKGDEERRGLENLEDLSEVCNELLSEQHNKLKSTTNISSEDYKLLESTLTENIQTPTETTQSPTETTHTSTETTHTSTETTRSPTETTHTPTETTHTPTETTQSPTELTHTPTENTQTLKDHTPVENNGTDSDSISSQGEGIEAEPQISDSLDMKHWLNRSVKVLIEHLNRYGVCVVDNFLGDEKGSKTFDEIWRMQKLEYFADGQVMSGGGQNVPTIRSDKITWTDGFSPLDTPYLRYCVRILDSIVLRANRVKNNGELGKYKLTGRTRIMCACYPGGGTRYVKHVDNPNKDGRVVTAIYYLNKNWNSQVDGGSLRIYSQVNKGKVIQIDPVFDRVVFFWSDARNPHEVLPANKPRYAITVWYLDEKEKQEYQRRNLEYEIGNIGAQACENINPNKGYQRKSPMGVINKSADPALKPVINERDLLLADREGRGIESDALIKKQRVDEVK